MPSKKIVFLDANVILEVLLARKNDAIAREYITKNAGNLHISALTSHLVVHFGTSIVTLPVLRNFLADYYVDDLTSQDFEWSFNNARSDDFEDALQLAVAIRNGCDVFATFDKNLYKNYKSLPTIKVMLLG